MKEKLKKEGKVLKLSVLLSAIFVIVEVIMTIVTKSQAMLMDVIFGVADLVIIVIISFLLPLIYKPVTEKRPYGYSQVESVFIIIKGILVSSITAVLIVDNVKTILSGGSEVDATGVVISDMLLGIYCILTFMFLKWKSKKINTPVIDADLVEWKIDMYTTFSMFLAFLVQLIIEKTKYAFVAPYIDSVFAIVISLIMIKEPIEMVIEAFKSLVLFAPEEETVDEIKKIVNKKLKKYPYDVTFFDIVKTGRKIWIELYIKSNDTQINLKELKKAKQDVEKSLKKNFDEIYVEFTPEI